MKKVCSKNSVRFFCVILVIIGLAGCTQFKLVESGKRIQVGDAFSVDTSINWSKLESENVETWTIDGPRLERLFFFKGIPDGKPLARVPEQKGESMPVFHASMTEVEMMELVVATLARTGGHDVKTADLRPYKLGTLDGFRFEFRYVSQQGLKYEGFVAGAQKERKFFALMYTGTALYHFEKRHQEVERILASLSVP